MKRVFFRVAYDGTHYRGWQTQKQGDTVEEVLCKHLSEALGEEIKLIGASRTDAGVHSLGNVAVFDTNTQIPADKIVYILNQRLPFDIRLQESKEVALDFHPRHTETMKTYRYQIYNHKFANPLQRWHSYFVHYPLDIDKMKEGSRYLVGEHNFKSFCTVRTEVTDMVRRIESIQISQNGHLISIDIRGNGFLYNMVRIIVGTLLQVGMGLIEVAQVKEVLGAQDRQKAGPTAPAMGLTLVRIDYPIEGY